MSNKVLIEKINMKIKEQISPILNKHLGDIILTKFSEGIASIKFTGNCGSCMAAEDTLNNVVKAILCQEVPEVKDVVIDRDVDEDILNFARNLMKKDK